MGSRPGAAITCTRPRCEAEGRLVAAAAATLDCGVVLREGGGGGASRHSVGVRASSSLQKAAPSANNSLAKFPTDLQNFPTP